MIRFLTLVVCLAALGGAGLFLHLQKQALGSPPVWPAMARAAADWPESCFSEKDSGTCPGDRFNFYTGLTLKPGATGSARLAINYRSSGDCLYAELSGRKVSLVAARGGFHRELAASELAAAPAPGVEHALEVRRRGPLVTAILDGRVVATAFAESYSGGVAKVGSRGPGLEFVGPRVTEIEPVLFLDDFMRQPDAASAWDRVSGQWQLKGIRNPSMSANAFRLCAAGKPAMSVTGRNFWDLYSLAASFRGAPGGQVGLVFACRDERNYGLFRWSARSKPLESAAGSAELVLVSGGQERVLQRVLLGYVPEQWYRAELRTGWGWAEVSVDGHLLLAAEEPELSGGRVGLWASSEADTFFDDVRVAEVDCFRERFSGTASTWKSWDFLGGQWKPADGSEAQGLAGSAGPEGGLALFGWSRWASYAVRAELLPQAGRCGLIYHCRDAANYSGLFYDSGAGRLELISVQDGEPRRLAETAVKLDPAMHVFEVKLDRGLVRATVDGRHEMVAWQTDGASGGGGLAGRGRAGLAVWSGTVLARSVSLRTLAELEPLPIINPIFTADAEMGAWSTWQGDWATDPPGAATPGLPRWHRARFSGDVTLLVEAESFVPGESELALSLAKSGEGKSNNGYVLKLSRAPATAPKLVLSRAGVTVGQAALPADERIWTLALRKAGPFVVGYVNSREQFSFQDSEPLAGQKVAWYSKGVTVEEDGFRVYCPAVQNDTFDRAPVDWRMGAGVWEVTNRWQCDPRWSFCSIYPVSREKKLAAIWNKHPFSDDAVVEFFAGIKMDGARGGQYQYARDINCTLSADGKDLSSGYSFLFGGFDDDHSAILRKGVEVARTPSGSEGVIPRQASIHHRWFYVRAERKGPKLHFTVDGGKLVDLTFTDPEPLTGKHLAIWTWDCGITISRVRVSGSPVGGFEPLDFVPGLKCLSPYPEAP